jgi:hypothetical protein
MKQAISVALIAVGCLVGYALPHPVCLGADACRRTGRPRSGQGTADLHDRRLQVPARRARQGRRLDGRRAAKQVRHESERSGRHVITPDRLMHDFEAGFSVETSAPVRSAGRQGSDRSGGAQPQMLMITGRVRSLAGVSNPLIAEV